MKTSVVGKMTGLGISSVAALCIAWSGLSSAADITTISKASVKIQYYEQTASGVTEVVKYKTDDIILELTGDAGDKPPNSHELVLLNYCDDPQELSVLAVWDKDTDDFVAESGHICLPHEGLALINDKKDTIYNSIDSGDLADAVGLDEIDMDVSIKLGKVKNKVDSSRPVCLKKFKTMAMAGWGDFDDGHFAVGNRVLKKTGSVKTNGGVKGALDGDVAAGLCF